MEDGLGWGCGLGFCGDDEEEGHTIARFLKAMPWVTMGCVDRDFMPQILEAHRCIDDQALCAADAKVGMEEDDVLLFEFRHEGLVRGIGLKGTLCGRVWLSTVAWGCVLVLSLDNPRDDLSQRWRNSTEVGACAWPRRLVGPHPQGQASLIPRRGGLPCCDKHVHQTRPRPFFESPMSLGFLRYNTLLSHFISNQLSLPN
jgi:hypothetical protein